MIAGEFSLEVKVDVVTKVHEMEDALVAFTKTDYVGYLRLGDLDIVGLRDPCQDAQGDGSSPGLISSLGDGNTLAHK